MYCAGCQDPSWPCSSVWEWWKKVSGKGVPSCPVLLASACMSHISGAVSVLCVTQAGAFPAACCKELWLQALKIDQRGGHLKPICLSLWLGGGKSVGRHCLVSLLLRVSLLAWPPQPQNHSLYSEGKRGHSPKPTVHQGPFVLLPSKDAMLWKIGPAKITALGHNSYILLFYFFKKIHQRLCLLVQRFDLNQAWLDTFTRGEALWVPMGSLVFCVCGKIYTT